MGHANAGELTIAASIGELHALLAAQGMAPGWDKPEPSLWDSPRRGDVFVAPAWRGHSHVAMERSHLLRVSDEPVMRKLNWLRTQ